MFKLPGRSAKAALRAARRLARGKGRTRALILCVLALAVCVLAVPVYAERSQSEGLAVYLRGGVSPRTLPRDHPSPVSVRLQAGIQTMNSVPLPRVKKISLELAYRGALDTEGLPLCRRTQLRALDTRHALATWGVSRRQGKPLLARLRAVSGPVRPPFSPACVQREDPSGPDGNLGPRLLTQSTDLLRPSIPRASTEGPLPHRIGQRSPPRPRHLAPFRSLQHGRHPPISLPWSGAQLPPRVLSAAPAVHIGPSIARPRDVQHRQRPRPQRGNRPNLPCRRLSGLCPD